MRSLREVIKDADEKGIAIGHFNVSDLVTLKAIVEVSRGLGMPVIVGVSEGEREFVGVGEIVSLVMYYREKERLPLYLNADHTHSFEKAKEAIACGFDAVLFDGGRLPFSENAKETRAVVEYAHATGRDIVVEGELGYIGSSSEMLKEAPRGAAIRSEEFTKPDEAAEFVTRTGVDLLAPAVGNIHGMFANAPEPALDILRVEAIRGAAGVPLVLHGASGNSRGEIRAAIMAGVRIVHINTEVRLAWREGVRDFIRGNPDEIAPYKILHPAEEKVRAVIEAHVLNFSGRAG